MCTGTEPSLPHREGGGLADLRDGDRGVARVHVHYCLSCSRRASRRGHEWIDTTHDSCVPIFPRDRVRDSQPARTSFRAREWGDGGWAERIGPRHATAGVRKGRSPERAPDRAGTDRESVAAATVTRRRGARGAAGSSEARSGQSRRGHQRFGSLPIRTRASRLQAAAGPGRRPQEAAMGSQSPTSSPGRRGRKGRPPPPL